MRNTRVMSIANEGHVVPGVVYRTAYDYMDLERLPAGTTVSIFDAHGVNLTLTTTRHMAGFPRPTDPLDTMTGVVVYSTNWTWFNENFLVSIGLLRVDAQIRVGQEFTFRTADRRGNTHKVNSFTVLPPGVLAK